MLAVRQYFSRRRVACIIFRLKRDNFDAAKRGGRAAKTSHESQKCRRAGEGGLTVVHLSLSLIGAIASSHPTEGDQRFIHRIQFKKNVCGSQSDFVRRHQTSIRFIKRLGWPWYGRGGNWNDSQDRRHELWPNRPDEVHVLLSHPF